MGKLNVTQIKKLNEPGKYLDGDGLYLVIGPGGSKSWVFRYALEKKSREMGLGGMSVVSLDEARDTAVAYRKMLREGRDPFSARIAEKVANRSLYGPGISFRDCAAEFIELQKEGWTCRRQVPIWTASLETHVYDIIGDVSVKDITKEHVIRIIRRMWDHRDEDGAPKPLYNSAMRVRARIETILRYATGKEYRVGENPARWKDCLEFILPDPLKKAQKRHQPSIPREELPDLFALVNEKQDPTHSALSFLILTAARTAEVSRATWQEFDLSEKVWTIPAERMKARREHRVPLSQAAIDILTHRRTIRVSSFVFPGRITGRPISNMALLMILRRYGRQEVSHGFRSTFKDWASEVFGAEDDVSEAALAHAIKDQTKAAYLRGDFFEKRKELMNAWALFCTSKMPHSGRANYPAMST